MTRDADVPSMGSTAPMAETETLPPPDWAEGDASVHLEDLVVAPLPELHGHFKVGASCRIELIGAHLRLRATLLLGGHRRLSDFLNNHDGLLECRDATVLRRNGVPTKVTASSIWVSPSDVTLIGDLDAAAGPGSPREFVQPRARRPIVVVTPGHTLTGDVYLAPEAELSVFIASNYPRVLPLTGVRTRSLADRRILAGYDFVLLNRSQIVAVTALQPGMGTGRAAI